MDAQFNEIEYKKPFYRIKQPLREHLRAYSRLTELPLSYDDLLRYRDLVPVTDSDGNETLWYAVVYSQSDMEFINRELTNIYELLIADGEDFPYLKIGSIEFCSFGNSQPFRIKVMNELNDNHDYFYIKRGDASRVYGLELEEIFSPDKVSFLVSGNTLIEEHIVGVPVDAFVLKNEGVKIDNRLRLAKEFVKFNERCFARLLGDMRSYNYVVEITQDFDNVQYRLRAIDFDQQSYEGRKNIYLPQYFKDNLPLVELAQELLTHETAAQYQKEERVAMRKRFLAARQRTRSLLRRMKRERLSTPENIRQLAHDLNHYYKSDDFSDATTMGDIVTRQLELSLGFSVFA